MRSRVLKGLFVIASKQIYLINIPYVILLYIYVETEKEWDVFSRLIIG